MTIDRFDPDGLIPPGGKVLVALSGGKDSVYLLHRLLDLAPARDLTVGAAHMNHLLRGPEADRDEAFVRDLCAALRVPLTVERRDVRACAAQRRAGIEETARTLRYEFLEDVRRREGYDLVATAHHADDQAETMLLNLARGAGSRGLSGIPPRRGRIVRPMLDVTGEEIRAYLSDRGLSYVEDSSNLDDTYSRNRLRRWALPAMRQVNGNMAAHAAAAARSLREDDAFLQELAETFLAVHLHCGALSARALRELPRPIAARALRSVCGPALTRQQTDAVLALCESTERKCLDLPGRRLTVEQGLLYLEPQAPVPVPTVVLTGERGSCTAGRWNISWEMGRMQGEIHNSFNTFLLNREKIQGTVCITQKRDGDRIRLAGRNCTKTLKALFQEHGLTRERRLSLPVLRDDAGVLAVPGFGPDERALAAPGDGVLIVSCTEIKETGGYEHDQ